MRHAHPASITLWLALFALGAGCAQSYKKDEALAEREPVNCATARGDLRILRSEKAHVEDQIAMGVTAVYPASAVVGIVLGTEETKIQVATGEYNHVLDLKIAAIQRTCRID